MLKFTQVIFCKIKKLLHDQDSPVNLIELFTYKIFEHSRYGVEEHFFYDDICNFFFAHKNYFLEE